MSRKTIRTFLLITGCMLCATGVVNAQQLTLQECYQLARAHYPAIKKMGLIARINEYELENADKKFLPQLTFSGQATYQSEVVDYATLLGEAPLPGAFTPPVLSRDQYRIQGEISQLLYDGGTTSGQKELANVNAALQQQRLGTDLYTLNDRINSIYFAVLLMDAQLRQNGLNKASIETQLQKTEAALENGVAFRSSVDELKAEIVNIEMAATEYRANRKGYLKMLSLLIGRELTEAQQLAIPQTGVVAATINRPELKVFNLQQSVYQTRQKELASGYLPQVNAFFQGAYGKPTLNILENKFGPWYIAGIRFNWALGSLYTLSNKKSALLLSQQNVAANRDTFLLNTELALAQQDENVRKYEALIKQDETAIALRSAVTKSAEAQLNNGVITMHEYIQKVNAEHLARQQKIVHGIQLLQAQYNQHFIAGN